MGECYAGIINESLRRRKLALFLHGRQGGVIRFGLSLPDDGLCRCDGGVVCCITPCFFNSKAYDPLTKEVGRVGGREPAFFCVAIQLRLF